MPKRTSGGNAIFDALDHVPAVKRHLDRENVPAERLQMSCGDLETAAGVVPVIVQTPYPGIIQTRADAERAALVHFGAEQPWPAHHRGLLDELQACVDAPIVYLAEAFVRVDRHGDTCAVTVDTPGKPGWTNQNDFAPAVFDYLASMAGIGGVLVHFADPFDRYVEPVEPETEQAITWRDIY